MRSYLEGYTPCYNFNNLGVDPSTWPVGWDDLTNHQLLSCDWSADGYRLPTEMEWMYAARGAIDSPDPIYSGSNDLNEVGWFVENSAGGKHPVGTLTPNQLGLYDMSGNLWEYCWDIYHNQYPTADVIDPTGPASGLYRVIRGGCWDSDASNCTVARRFYTPTYLTTNFIGVRVVRKAF
jgi:formylglycine-generating enzyme required for sulfatase activity